MITDAQIQKALRSKATTDLIEGAGRGTGRLVLRCKDGRAHWYVRWFDGPQKRFMRIGRYPSTTLLQARVIFNTEYAPRILEGDKPQKVTAANGTVRELFTAYCDAMEAAGKVSAKEARKGLTRFADFVGRETPAARVTTDDVIKFLRPIFGRGSAGMADHLRSYIRSSFNWAIKTANDYRSDTPVSFGVKVNPADKIPTEPKRALNRYLSPDELRAFWKWLKAAKRNVGNHELTATTLKAIQLQAITGQRFVEIARIRPEMVDWEQCTVEWHKTKTGKPHIIPLPSAALDILRSVEPNAHGWYFPSAYDESQPVRNRAASYAVLRYLELSGAEKFMCRDLRRTWKTLSGQAGLTKTDRDLLQNHSKGDVSSVHYDRWECLPEKRAAMKVWEEWWIREIEKAP